jgi:hypothetical protein
MKGMHELIMTPAVVLMIMIADLHLEVSTVGLVRTLTEVVVPSTAEKKEQSPFTDITKAITYMELHP